jgi:Putative inner membrane protein (DUF1819)
MSLYNGETTCLFYAGSRYLITKAEHGRSKLPPASYVLIDQVLSSWASLLKGSVVIRMATKEIAWRATGIYVPTLASKASLLEETRVFLETYAQCGSIEQASQLLNDGGLPQRSRRTRTTIVGIIRMRLTRWHPPAWVLDDLVSFARDTRSDAFPLAVLLHTARQDRLLYDFVQKVVVPRWYNGTYKLIPSDVQGFLDTMQPEHPEISHWGYTTRERLSNGVLTVLRDCKLLKGEVNKYIGTPLVPTAAVEHLIHLLQGEEISQDVMAQHLDWRLWLWDTTQAQGAIDICIRQEHMA